MADHMPHPKPDDARPILKRLSLRKIALSEYLRVFFFAAPKDSNGNKAPKFKRLRANKVAVLLFILVILSAVLTYAALNEAPPFGDDPKLVIWLLNVDLILLLVFVAMIAKRIVSVWSGRKRGLAGSHLHVRLVYIFSILAAAPAIIMTVFSAFFFHYGVQTWFSQRVQTAVTESQAVAEAYLEEHQQLIRADASAMASDLNREAALLISNPASFERVIRTQSVIRNLPEVIIMDSSGRVSVRSGLTFTMEMMDVPQDTLQRADGGEVVLLRGSGDQADRIRALVKLNSFVDSYLFVGRMVDEKVLRHLTDTKKAVQDYEALQTRYAGLQVTVTLIFVVVGLLMVLAAIWFGLILARQLVTPISQLVQVTERVRGGDLTARVEESETLQEFDFLARAFNRMTKQIQEQRAELIDTNRQLDRRRHFTETVLSGVSSGIMALRDGDVVNIANQSACDLLGVGNDELRGSHIIVLLPELSEMLDKGQEKLGRVIQQEITYERNKKKKTFLVRLLVEEITSADGNVEQGAVITFDDMTALQAAQRKAAWADVARRIAHEIKNPLTPIQLSAERLHRKYKDEITSSPDVFTQCTETIIKHVGDIEHMVNEFSSFARMPEAKIVPLPIGDTIDEVIILHKQANPDITFARHNSGENWDGIVAHDPQLIRQGLNNLVQNAVDSLHEGNVEDAQIIVTLHHDLTHGAAIVVSDNGAGLPAQEHEDQLLEPYVTRKVKGTGLGLAIVKKVMEEHGGQIILGAPEWLEQHDELLLLSGATIVLAFSA